MFEDIKEYKEIYDYIKRISFEGRILDINALSNFCTSFSVGNDLEDYCDSLLEFTGNDFDGLYDYDNNCIYIDKDFIINRLNYEHPFIINLILLQVLIHELTHAYQFKFVEQFMNFKYVECNDINKYMEYKLLNDSFYFGSPSINLNSKLYKEYLKTLNVNPGDGETMVDIYHEFYNYNPSERLAELNSIKTVLNFINEFEEIDELKTTLYDYFYESYLMEELNGYYQGKDEVYSATESFVDCMNIEFIDKNIWNMLKSIYEDKSIDDPWYYGLKVPLEELNKKKLVLQEVQNYNSSIII